MSMYDLALECQRLSDENAALKAEIVQMKSQSWTTIDISTLEIEQTSDNQFRRWQAPTHCILAFSLASGGYHFTLLKEGVFTYLTEVSGHLYLPIPGVPSDA